MSTEESVRFFLFCLELELFAKIKKDLVSTHSQKPGLSITQRVSFKFKYWIFHHLISIIELQND